MDFKIHPDENNNSVPMSSVYRLYKINNLTKLKRKLATTSRLILNGRFKEINMRLHLYKRMSKFIKNPDNFVLDSVQMIITEKCTLKCNGCLALMQYYSHPQHTDFSQMCRDLDLFMSHINFVGNLGIIGGEPLMVKQFPALLAHMYKYKNKYGILQITTNGTIVPSQEVLTAMRTYNVYVYISDYGEKSVNLNRLISALKANKILYDFYALHWTDCGRIIDGEKRSESDVQDTYSKCTMECNHIFNGRFYHCAFLAHGDNLRAFPDDPSNYVDLLNKTLAKEDFKRYKSEAKVPIGCRYCNGFNPDLPSIPVADQLKAPLPYQIF